MADEVTDISGWEQLGVALHYKKNKKLVEFVACESNTGRDISMNL